MTARKQQNTNFTLLWGSITQQEVIFMSIIFAIVLYYYSRYDFDSFFKKIFARVWTLIGPKEESELNFSIFCLAIPRLVKKLGEK